MKLLVIIFILFNLFNSCVPEYKITNKTPPIGTLSLNQIYESDFVLSYTKLIRSESSFYNVPDNLANKLADAYDPRMSNYKKDIFYYVSGKYECILHMDYTYSANLLVNVFCPKKDSTKWLNGNDSISGFEKTILTEYYNSIIDSLINIAIENGKSKDEIYFNW